MLLRQHLDPLDLSCEIELPQLLVEIWNRAPGRFYLSHLFLIGRHYDLRSGSMGLDRRSL